MGTSPFPFETGVVRGAPAAQLWLESQVDTSPFPFETGLVRGAPAAQLWLESQVGTSPFLFEIGAVWGTPALRGLLEIAMAAYAVPDAAPLGAGGWAVLNLSYLP